MKKLLILFFALSFFSFPFNSFAQEEIVEDTPLFPSEEEESVETISPDSPFYFLTSFSEEIQLFFTFNEEKKATKALEFAEKKLAAMESLGEDADPELLEKLQARFERLIQHTERVQQKTEDKEQAMEQRVENIRTRHLNVLQKVYDQVPEGQAQESIRKVIDKTSAKYAEKDSKVKSNNKGGIVKDVTPDDTEEVEVEEELD